MRQIQFKAFGSSAAFGSFAPGDTLRCADDVARHFVEEARAADYADAVQAPAQQPAAAQPEQPAAATRPAAKRARRATGA